MANFFADNFANCVWLAVFLVAAFPMLESKVSIPLALSAAVWGNSTISPAAAFFLSLFGCIAAGVLAICIARFVKNRTSGFVCEKFLSRFSKKHKRSLEKLKSKNTVFGKCLAIATFVAIPLPLTGVWTGGLLAGLSNLKFWQGFAAVCAGEVVSAGIVMLLCMVLENSATYILLFSLGLIALFVGINVVATLVRRCKKNKSGREKNESVLQEK